MERLLRDTTLITLAFAIALGWSLYQLAAEIAGFITTAMQDTDDPRALPPGEFPPFSLRWGDHLFYYLPVLKSLIVVVVLLAVALIVHRRLRTA